MCGIVGLLLKRFDHRTSLGALVTPMLDCMGDRGPDSAGLAVFLEPVDASLRRYSLYWGGETIDWADLLLGHQEAGHGAATLESTADNAVLISDVAEAELCTWLTTRWPAVHLLSVGRSIQLFKDEGHPRDIAARYRFDQLAGSHAVGHTRMATESMVSPAHAHPFTAGEDFCLVHNGSLSNPNSIRRRLQRRGIRFQTDNDTEAGCRYLEWRMQEGDSLEQALEAAFDVLDGFYTLLMATGEKLVLVRDAFACKPAVVAETDDYVAVGSEFRALAHLPGISDANVYEPAPEQIYSWSVADTVSPKTTAVAS
ncbi:MAG: amidophosphoribosyltransferase [Planctomycetaceae bacterium]|nr:amidophosphoribosyltransferase [Planctomycetaceae bacterium]